MRDDADRRGGSWPQVALTVIGLLATAVATTYVIKTGATATLSDTISAPRTVVATIAPAPAPAQSDPAPSNPVAAQALERPVRVAAPVPQAQVQTDLRQIAYTVAGNQRPDDPVTVIYADETGTLQRAENVTLPWTLTLTPSLPVSYVMASSRGSQLNCWITDAAGSTVASSTEFSPSASCNR